MKRANEFSSDMVAEHLENLCGKIGNRLAGTAGERKAARYIERKFKEFGLSNVRLEKFPCVSWRCKKAELSIKDGKWRKINCLPLAHSLSTKGTIEAELIYLESASAVDLAGKDLKGKVGLVLGGFGNTPDKYIRLRDSGLAAIILVDERFPFEWPVAMGISRFWRRLGRLTGITISYMDAWRMVKRGVKRVRVAINVAIRHTHSFNVVGEVKGENARKVMVICAHYDSVYGNVGAEDDGSGVVCVLELARAFARTKPTRTLRFITFGTEEQLSEGSKNYVLQHEKEMGDIDFVLNTDSVASWMGRNEIFVSGTNELAKFARSVADANKFSAQILREISPFSDQFPFNMFGIPSLWFHRSNFPGGRWFHHSAHDTPDVISPELLLHTIRVEGAILGELAQRKRLPFPRSIPPSQMKKVEFYKRNLYGL